MVDMAARPGEGGGLHVQTQCVFSERLNKFPRKLAHENETKYLPGDVEAEITVNHTLESRNQIIYQSQQEISS